MFESRIHAGKILVEKLRQEKITADLVLGIPRGGVVIAKEIACSLRIPLDVIIVKKLGAPLNPELAIGAIASDDVSYIDTRLATSVGADQEYIKQEIINKHHELSTRAKALRINKPKLQVKGKQVIITDDGVATGATMFAAIDWLRQNKAKKIILALPVAPKDTVDKLNKLVDQCIILDKPVFFGAVGQFYQDFSQVSDEQVIRLLNA